jgi:predicted phosphodiesterase
MSVAVLCDIHGNLPALSAVLAEVAEARVDRIVVGGDIVPGPMPRQALDRLLTTDVPVQFVHGNGERSALAQMAALQGAPVTYWGTTSGNPLPEKDHEIMRWTALELGPDDQRLFASWPRTLTLDVDGLGKVLVCHATPRSETEIFTRLTPEERLRPLYEGLSVAVVVCGHTHMPFDRHVGSTRVVNPGSVGMPFGEPGAYWALLGADVELKRTSYDLAQAAAAIRATSHPYAEEQARNILQPPAQEEMLELFETFAVK